MLLLQHKHNSFFGVFFGLTGLGCEVQTQNTDIKTITLAAPRGFCAGVERAVKIVEVAIEKFGAPVYVRHEIVHNKRVVDDLAAKGAVFVRELGEVPTGAPVVFSAHGVAKSVHERADALNMIAVDATCPLVTKVHNEAARHVKHDKHILLIGHAGHPGCPAWPISSICLSCFTCLAASL